MIKKWLYFGCYQQAGHYLFQEGMRGQYYDRAIEKLTRFDGMLAPQDSTLPYIATVSRLEGFGVSALSFWDYSVDKRGGCNSIFFAPYLDISPSAFIHDAAARFPEVWARLPEVKLKGH